MVLLLGSVKNLPYAEETIEQSGTCQHRDDPEAETEYLARIRRLVSGPVRVTCKPVCF